ncbi:hypothetical protein [Streptomyces sp. NPDC001980]
MSTSHRTEDQSVPVLSATYDDLCFANHRDRLSAPDPEEVFVQVHGIR